MQPLPCDIGTFKIKLGYPFQKYLPAQEAPFKQCCSNETGKTAGHLFTSCVQSRYHMEKAQFQCLLLKLFLKSYFSVTETAGNAKECALKKYPMNRIRAGYERFKGAYSKYADSKGGVHTKSEIAKRSEQIPEKQCVRSSSLLL